MRFFAQAQNDKDFTLYFIRSIFYVSCPPPPLCHPEWSDSRVKDLERRYEQKISTQRLMRFFAQAQNDNNRQLLLLSQFRQRFQGIKLY